MFTFFAHIELVYVLKGLLIFSPFYFFRMRFLQPTRKLTVVIPLIFITLFILLSPFSFVGWFADCFLFLVTTTLTLGTFVKNISVQGVTIARATSFSLFFLFVQISSMFGPQLIKSYNQDGLLFNVFETLDPLSSDPYRLTIHQRWKIFETKLYKGPVRWDDCNRYEYNPETETLLTFDERPLHKKVNVFDQALRKDDFQLSLINEQFHGISEELKKFSTLTINETDKVCSIFYKWNCDSSMVMVKSSKRIGKEFKRETIFNFSDTSIVISRFHCWPGNPDRKPTETIRYIFLEEVRYLTQDKPVKVWRRSTMTNTQLADTIAFQRMPFEEHVATEKSYGIEMSYARKIRFRN